jgi:predicted DNA-binding transcriptional regulator YafY
MHRRVLQRMGWIEASLRFAGRFASGEKAAYMDRFGVGSAQVSQDQGRFTQELNKRCGAILSEVARGKLKIVESAKLPAEPVFEMPRMTEWLEVAMGSAFLRVESARRAEPDILTLRAIVVAIRERVPLEILYLSRSSGKSRRVISPHVIVDVVDRLHLRGYDHAQNRFSDFVLSRIEESRPAPDIPFVRPDRDEDWRRLVWIEICAHAELVGERRRGVMRDFGLNEAGSRQVRRRAAVARYLVDQPADAMAGFASPVSIRIVE